MRNIGRYYGAEFAKIVANKKTKENIYGVKYKTVKFNGVSGVEVNLDDFNSVGASSGLYYTFDGENKPTDKLIKALSRAIKLMLPTEYNKVLVLGMGNDSIVSDTLGTQSVKLLNINKLGENYAKFCPLVKGKTGLDSFSVIKGITSVFKPDVVVVVDSLLTTELARLGSSFQLTDAGITPGSAVGNNKCNLTAKTLDCKTIISIGVPLVVKLDAVVSGVLNKINPQVKTLEDYNKLNLDHIFSPKDIDFLVEDGATIIARAIENAFI